MLAFFYQHQPDPNYGICFVFLRHESQEHGARHSGCRRWQSRADHGGFQRSDVTEPRESEGYIGFTTISNDLDDDWG